MELLNSAKENWTKEINNRLTDIAEDIRSEVTALEETVEY